MAEMAADGSWQPVIVTLAIATLLAIWSAYAFSGAGVLKDLPFARYALLAITSIYLFRGVVGLAVASGAPGGNSTLFWICSSLICLAIGAVHALGLWLRWGHLSRGVV